MLVPWEWQRNVSFVQGSRADKGSFGPAKLLALRATRSQLGAGGVGRNRSGWLLLVQDTRSL